jgi:hypothetical protein
MLATGARAAPSEHEVKAAFLANFARFVEWPAKFHDDVLVIVEPDPFGRTIDATTADATLPVRLSVQRLASPGAPPACRILFAGRRSGAAGLAALARVGDSTLTVGETEEFLARGGMVRLAVMDGRVRVEINVDAVERSQLRVSSKLLKIATLRHESELK